MIRSSARKGGGVGGAARLTGAEGDAAEASGHEKLLRGFSRSIALEAVIARVVLLVTAALVFMTPARSHPAMTPSEHPAMSSAGTGPVVSR